jgi:hypothetical protein
MSDEPKESTVHDAISEDLKARSRWADRQAVWYNMRHEGIRRKRKPYTGAPDFHFPLLDMVVEKLKPFYYRQLFASELMAEFISMRSQQPEMTQQAAQWFDSHMKLETNLLEEIVFVIDAMLQGGKGICRPFYNAEDDCIEFDSIDPLNFIVPAGTKRLQKAGRMVHVECLTRAEYATRKTYNQDGAFIKRIVGKGQSRELKFDEKITREGLTYGGSDEIVIWNVWERENGLWVMKTLSPVDRQAIIRPPLKNPFRHGMAPFVDFRRELKEKGFYDSRGEGEKAGAFESYLNKLWNKKGEALDFFGTPLFTSDDPAAEGKSLRFNPGEFVPRGIRRVEWGAPPFPFDQEMMQTRAIAEQRIGMPDFGIGGGNNLSEARTATEVDKLAELGGITTDMRAQTFRIDFRRLLQMAWSLALQYKSRDLDFIYQMEARRADAAALHDGYNVQVGGSAESWNRKLEIQKAGALYTQAKGDPYFDQLELRKLFTESVNPRWVKRLVRDPKLQANVEAEDEMIRIPAIMEGAPIQPSAEQNHQVRAEVIWQKLQQLRGTNTPVDPVAQQGLVGYLNKRLALWAQQDPKSAKAWWNEKQAMMKAEAEQREQQQALPGGMGNMVPFQLAAGGAR